METPGTYDMTIYKGNDFEKLFSFKNADETVMDLTGYTIRSQVRDFPGRGETLLMEFTVEIPTPANGEVTLKATDVQTGAVEPSKGYYDILLTNSNNNDFDTTYVKGEITFEPTNTAKE